MAGRFFQMPSAMRLFAFGGLFWGCRTQLHVFIAATACALRKQLPQQERNYASSSTT